MGAFAVCGSYGSCVVCKHICGVCRRHLKHFTCECVRVAIAGGAMADAAADVGGGAIADVVVVVVT